jgi:hypothetical protein
MVRCQFPENYSDAGIAVFGSYCYQYSLSGGCGCDDFDDRSSSFRKLTMIQKMLNFVPIEILRQLHNEVVRNLQQREMIGWNKSEQGEPSYYLGLQIKITPKARLDYWDWDWFIYDGGGVNIIKTGTAKTENDAYDLAMAWTNNFLTG